MKQLVLSSIGLAVLLSAQTSFAQNYFGAGSTARPYAGSYANSTPRYIAPPPPVRYQSPPMAFPGSTMPVPRAPSFVSPYAGSTPMYPRSFGGSTMPVPPRPTYRR